MELKGRDSQQLRKKQKRQMQKIKDLMQKLTEYEESGMADVASLNLNYDEREVIKRALVCHLEFLRTVTRQNDQATKEKGNEA